MNLGMLRRSSTNMSMCITWNVITVCSGRLSNLSKEKSTMAHLQSRAPCRYGFNEQSSYQALSEDEVEKIIKECVISVRS